MPREPVLTMQLPRAPDWSRVLGRFVDARSSYAKQFHQYASGDIRDPKIRVKNWESLLAYLSGDRTQQTSLMQLQAHARLLSLHELVLVRFLAVLLRIETSRQANTFHSENAAELMGRLLDDNASEGLPRAWKVCLPRVDPNRIGFLGQFVKPETIGIILGQFPTLDERQRVIFLRRFQTDVVRLLSFAASKHAECLPPNFPNVLREIFATVVPIAGWDSGAKDEDALKTDKVKLAFHILRNLVPGSPLYQHLSDSDRESVVMLAHDYLVKYAKHWYVRQFLKLEALPAPSVLARVLPILKPDDQVVVLRKAWEQCCDAKARDELLSSVSGLDPVAGQVINYFLVSKIVSQLSALPRISGPHYEDTAGSEAGFAMRSTQRLKGMRAAAAKAAKKNALTQQLAKCLVFGVGDIDSLNGVANLPAIPVAHLNALYGALPREEGALDTYQRGVAFILAVLRRVSAEDATAVALRQRMAGEFSALIAYPPVLLSKPDLEQLLVLALQDERTQHHVWDAAASRAYNLTNDQLLNLACQSREVWAIRGFLGYYHDALRPTTDSILMERRGSQDSRHSQESAAHSLASTIRRDSTDSGSGPAGTDSDSDVSTSGEVSGTDRVAILIRAVQWGVSHRVSSHNMMILLKAAYPNHMSSKDKLTALNLLLTQLRDKGLSETEIYTNPQVRHLALSLSGQKGTLGIYGKVLTHLASSDLEELGRVASVTPVSTMHDLVGMLEYRTVVLQNLPLFKRVNLTEVPVSVLNEFLNELTASGHVEQRREVMRAILRQARVEHQDIVKALVDRYQSEVLTLVGDGKLVLGDATSKTLILHQVAGRFIFLDMFWKSRRQKLIEVASLLPQDELGKLLAEKQELQSLLNSAAQVQMMRSGMLPRFSKVSASTATRVETASEDILKLLRICTLPAYAAELTADDACFVKGQFYPRDLVGWVYTAVREDDFVKVAFSMDGTLNPHRIETAKGFQALEQAISEHPEFLGPSAEAFWDQHSTLFMMLLRRSKNVDVLKAVLGRVHRHGWRGLTLSDFQRLLNHAEDRLHLDELFLLIDQCKLLRGASDAVRRYICAHRAAEITAKERLLTLFGKSGYVLDDTTCVDAETCVEVVTECLVSTKDLLALVLTGKVRGDLLSPMARALLLSPHHAAQLSGEQVAALDSRLGGDDFSKLVMAMKVPEDVTESNMISAKVAYVVLPRRAKHRMVNKLEVWQRARLVRMILTERKTVAELEYETFEKHMNAQTKEMHLQLLKRLMHRVAGDRSVDELVDNLLQIYITRHFDECDVATLSEDPVCVNFFARCMKDRSFARLVTPEIVLQLPIDKLINNDDVLLQLAGLPVLLAALLRANLDDGVRLECLLKHVEFDEFVAMLRDDLDASQMTRLVVAYLNKHAPVIPSAQVVTKEQVMQLAQKVGQKRDVTHSAWQMMFALLQDLFTDDAVNGTAKARLNHLFFGADAISSWIIHVPDEELEDLVRVAWCNLSEEEAQVDGWARGSMFWLLVQNPSVRHRVEQYLISRGALSQASTEFVTMCAMWLMGVPNYKTGRDDHNYEYIGDSLARVAELNPEQQRLVAKYANSEQVLCKLAQVSEDDVTLRLLVARKKLAVDRVISQRHSDDIISDNLLLTIAEGRDHFVLRSLSQSSGRSKVRDDARSKLQDQNMSIPAHNWAVPVLQAMVEGADAQPSDAGEGARAIRFAQYLFDVAAKENDHEREREWDQICPDYTNPKEVVDCLEIMCARDFCVDKRARTFLEEKLDHAKKQAGRSWFGRLYDRVARAARRIFRPEKIENPELLKGLGRPVPEKKVEPVVAEEHEDTTARVVKDVGKSAAAANDSRRVSVARRIRLSTMFAVLPYSHGPASVPIHPADGSVNAGERMRLPPPPKQSVAKAAATVGWTNAEPGVGSRVPSPSLSPSGSGRLGPVLSALLKGPGTFAPAVLAAEAEGAEAGSMARGRGRKSFGSSSRRRRVRTPDIAPSAPSDHVVANM